MSSQKVDRPTLQGQRIKTRKRDEKEKFDPGAFREQFLIGLSTILTPDSPSSAVPVVDGVVVEGSNNGSNTATTITKDHLEALYKYLDTQGGSGKIDYRKYGESLFDILIAGGILAPGGTILIDPDSAKPSKTDLCVFSAADVETIRGFANVVLKLIRRYKYLEKTLWDEFEKIIKFLKGFTPEERIKLAKFTGILIAAGQVPAHVLGSALQDYFVKDGIAGEFLVTVLQIWLEDKQDATAIWTSMKKAGLDQKIMDFFPAGKRNAESLSATFVEAGLQQLLSYQKAGLGDKAKKELQSQVSTMVKDEAPVKEITAIVKEAIQKNGIQEHDVVILLWNTVMNAIEWNKKEELVADQALKHLKGYTGLFANFTSSARSELALLVRMQDFCYENMNFLKVFQKVVVLFYKAEVLGEDAVLKWYKDGHSNKGKSVFLEQMKKFVEWLQNAEEESEDEN